MLSVLNNPFMLSVAMLNVIMMSVFILSVMAPLELGLGSVMTNPFTDYFL